MSRALMSKDEGLEAFQKLDAAAARLLKRSKDSLGLAILALDSIREDGLFTFGGYEDWDTYLRDFLDQNGISRSLVYENLSVTRLAKSASFTAQELDEIGLYTIKPYFERDGPIIDYNRRTGEILEIEPSVEAQLPKLEAALGERYGAWVRSRIEAEEPPYIVRRDLQNEMGKRIIRFSGVFTDGELNGIAWSIEEGDNYEEGSIAVKAKGTPEEILREIFKRLKIPMEWRE